MRYVHGQRLKSFNKKLTSLIASLAILVNSAGIALPFLLTQKASAATTPSITKLEASFRSDVHMLSGTAPVGYKGIAIQSSFANITDATSYKFTVHRDNSANKVVKQATQKLLDDNINHRKTGGISTPIVITQGDYNEAASESWEYAPGFTSTGWTKDTKPNQIDLEITLASSSSITRSIYFNDITGNWDDVIPSITDDIRYSTMSKAKGASYDGIVVDFGIKGFYDAENCTIILHRTKGGDAVRTCGQELLDHINSTYLGNRKSTTAPFNVLGSGVSSWFATTTGGWSTETVPSGVTIEITSASIGKISQTAKGTLVTNNGTYAEIAPSVEFISASSYFVKTKYKGIATDFKVNHLTDATGVEIRVSRDGASDIVKTAKQPVIDAISSGSKVTQTAPIVIQNISYNEDGSSSWNTPTGDPWTNSSKPEVITVTITRENGDDLVKQIRLNEIGTSKATLDEVMPTHVPNVVSITPGKGGFIKGKSQKIYINITNPDVMRGGYLQLNKTVDNGTPSNASRINYPLQKDGQGWYTLVNTTTLEDTKYLFKVEAHGAKTPWGYYGNRSNWGSPSYYLIVDNKLPTIKDATLSHRVLSIATGNPTLWANVTDKGLAGINDIRYSVYKTAGEQSHGGAPSVLSGTLEADEYGDIEKIMEGLSALPDGNYLLEIVASDNAGNTKRLRPYIEFTVDNTPPDTPTGFTLTGADGIIPPNGFTNSYTVVASWSIDPDVAGYEYRYSNSIPNDKYSNSYYVTQTTLSTRAGDFNRGEGLHHLQVRAVDAAGNWSGWSDTFNVTYDRTPPTAPTITAPGARTWHNSAPITASWSESFDDLSGINRYQVAYQYDDGHVFSGSTCDDTSLAIGDSSKFIGCRDVNGLSRKHKPAASEQGGVTIWVRAIDSAGNASAWSKPVHYYYDHEAPTTTHPEVSSVVEGVFTVSGYASDNLALNRVYVQLVSRDTNVRCGGTTINLIPDGKTSSWSKTYSLDTFITDTCPEGQYAAHASVVDRAGNSSSTGWTENFAISRSDNYSNEDSNGAEEVMGDSDHQSSGAGAGDLTVTGGSPAGSGRQSSTNRPLGLYGGGGATVLAAETDGADADSLNRSAAQSDLDAARTLAANDANIESTATDNTDGCGKLLGICWYLWIPLVIVGLGAIYYTTSRRADER